MSIRTIEAPGVEIVEIDKSEYTDYRGGSSTALVTGFASQGQNYEPMQFTSKSSLVNYYGEPTNEAERYFYAACSEVLNQNGKLVACKLPYDNASTDKYIYSEYEVKLSASIGDLTSVLNVSDKADKIYKSLSSETGELSSVKYNYDFATDLRNAFLEEYTFELTDSDKVSAIDNVMSASTGEEIFDNVISACSDLTGTLADNEKNLFTTVLSTASIDRFVSFFKDESTLSVDIASVFSGGNAFASIKAIDNTIDTVSKIEYVSRTNAMSAITTDVLDGYVVGEAKPSNNHFIIVDRLGGQYAKSSDGTEILGIIPVVTTAANAMYFQNIIDSSSDIIKDFSSISGIVSNSGTELLSTELAIPCVGDDVDDDSVSKRVANYFPPVVFLSPTQLDRENLQKIGVVVLKAYVDPSTANKVNFDVLESFVGSLVPNSVDPATGVTTFIDKIVNATSEYIYLFSNVSKVDADVLAMSEQTAKSFGFTAAQLQKDISVAKIYDGLTKVFQKNEDIHERQIDYVVDAGVSNIAQYIKDVFGDAKGPYDPAGKYAKMFKLRSDEDKTTWAGIIDKYNVFCSKTRKDCMFICDGLRPFSLQGSKKIVRPTKPSNTIENVIIPNLKYLAGLNTNYGAGYCDWFQITDEFTGESFWCPPSVQAVGCNIFTDLNYNYWDAPAGMKRGVIRAIDCSFSPSIKQAGSIYNKSWNYAINYADVGLIMEGQKTLQQKKSAFDRINVRKLFLRLERQVYDIARQFVYEINNAYTRQRFVDRLDPIFKNVLANGGIYDYKIICDETINTPEVIDNSELRAKIGIRPSKVAEFIYIQFYALRTGGSWDEMNG